MPGPAMESVSSSNIDAIGYDAENQVVHVTFKNGGTYAYRGVSQEDFHALRAAPSVGAHLNAKFKGVFSSEKL